MHACFFFGLFLGVKIFFYYILRNKRQTKLLVNNSIFFYGGVNNSFYCLEKLEKINIPFINFLIINEPLKKDKSAPSTKATVTINDNL
jgi:predicted membrane protein